MVRLSRLAALPSRETPLYLSEAAAVLSTVDLRVSLPEGSRVTTSLSPWSAEDGGRAVRVNDHVERGELVVTRQIDIPAGRVQPEDYAAFQAFTRSADAALHRDIVISLR